MTKIEIRKACSMHTAVVIYNTFLGKTVKAKGLLKTYRKMGK